MLTAMTLMQRALSRIMEVKIEQYVNPYQAKGRAASMCCQAMLAAMA